MLATGLLLFSLMIASFVMLAYINMILFGLSVAAGIAASYYYVGGFEVSSTIVMCFLIVTLMNFLYIVGKAGKLFSLKGIGISALLGYLLGRGISKM